LQQIPRLIRRAAPARAGLCLAPGKVVPQSSSKARLAGVLRCSGGLRVGSMLRHGKYGLIFYP